MKFKFTVIILLALIFLGCKSKKIEEINVLLSIVESHNNFFLQLEFTNNTEKYIYTPNLSGLLMSHNLVICDKEGKNISENFHLQELNDRINRFGPRMGQVNSFCKECETLSERNNLDLPPFSDRKNRINRMINYEFNNLLTLNSISELTENDTSIIKDMIFSKYSNCIFLKPGEIFKDCITINTLLKEKKQYEVILKYPALEKIEQYNYLLESSEEQFKINSKLPSEFEGYKLFNQPLTSNKLMINNTLND